MSTEKHKIENEKDTKIGWINRKCFMLCAWDKWKRKKVTKKKENVSNQQRLCWEHTVRRQKKALGKRARVQWMNEKLNEAHYSRIIFGNIRGTICVYAKHEHQHFSFYLLLFHSNVFRSFLVFFVQIFFYVIFLNEMTSNQGKYTHIFFSTTYKIRENKRNKNENPCIWIIFELFHSFFFCIFFRLYSVFFFLRSFQANPRNCTTTLLYL